jgi:hypothetical protein
MVKRNFIAELYKDSRTVFRLKDVAMLFEEQNSETLKRRLNYYVKAGDILNPRRGIYAKSGYKIEELGCLLYTPSYISMEYVLQRAGVIFQYDSAITMASYLKREISIDVQTLQYRQFKGEILINTEGIILRTNNINMATPERALLDILYLNSNFYFDNLRPLDEKQLKKLLSVYNSTAMEQKIKKLFPKL